MIKILGCFLIILSGGLTGLTLYSDLVRTVRSVELMQRILEIEHVTNAILVIRL